MELEHTKSLDHPDESIRLPGLTEDVVRIGDYTVGRAVQAPGWRWSVDMQPSVGGEWCEARHVGVTISGRWGAVFRDGSVVECAAGDVYDCAPGHDGYTIGDESCVLIEWSGIETWTGFRTGLQNRVLATLLFTDVVDSTATATRLGDAAWQALLSRHFEATRRQLERSRGREVTTTGDGFLAAFDGPAAALRCAVAIRVAAAEEGIRIRAGIHVGEVEVVGADVRGIAVHEAARIMGQAGADEIFVSESTRVLAHGSDLMFDDRGLHELKGLPEPRRLFSYRTPKDGGS